jgi:hypothetical protein
MQPLFLNSQSLITAHWGAVERLLAPVETRAAHGEFTVADLEELCREGRAVAAVGFDPHPVIAMVFETVHYPRRMNLRVIAMGGSNLAGARTFWSQFVAWAGESGASEIEAWTSPAMTRMLRPLGFAPAYDLVRMPCR